MLLSFACIGVFKFPLLPSVIVLTSLAIWVGFRQDRS
jgi:hypothetical protein